MPSNAIRRISAVHGFVGARRRQVVVWVAIAVLLVGVFSTWTEAGPVTLNGTEGPNNGWLLVILAVPALAWARMMERGSWIGVIGLLGAALGERVEAGQPLLTLHASSAARLAEGRAALDGAYDLTDSPVATTPLVLEKVV